MKMHEQPGWSDTAQSASPSDQPSTKTSALEKAFELLQNIVKTNRDFFVKDAFIVDDLEIQMRRGYRFKRTEFSTLVLGSVYSVTRMDYCIGITNLSYAATVGLPSPKEAGAGKTYLIKDEVGDAATTTITIRSFGDATIDGATSTTIATGFGARMVYTDGNQWYIGLN
jgi:hypothetical protein